MKAVTKFESKDCRVYDSEEDAKFADLVWEFNKNLIEEMSEYEREHVANEVRRRLAIDIHSTRFTDFLKWVRRERHAFAAFLEAIKNAD